MTPSPSVTWPSPAMTTVPLRRTLRTAVERIRRVVGMSAILDYNSAFDVGASAPLVRGGRQSVRGTKIGTEDWTRKHERKIESAENGDARAWALAPAFIAARSAALPAGRRRCLRFSSGKNARAGRLEPAQRLSRDKANSARLPYPDGRFVRRG